MKAASQITSSQRSVLALADLRNLEIDAGRAMATITVDTANHTRSILKPPNIWDAKMWSE